MTYTVDFHIITIKKKKRKDKDLFVCVVCRCHKDGMIYTVDFHIITIKKEEKRQRLICMCCMQMSQRWHDFAEDLGVCLCRICWEWDWRCCKGDKPSHAQPKASPPWVTPSSTSCLPWLMSWTVPILGEFFWGGGAHVCVCLSLLSLNRYFAKIYFWTFPFGFSVSCLWTNILLRIISEPFLLGFLSSFLKQIFCFWGNSMEVFCHCCWSRDRIPWEYILIAACSLQVCAVWGVKLEVGGGVDGNVLVAGTCSAWSQVGSWSWCWCDVLIAGVCGAQSQVGSWSWCWVLWCAHSRCLVLDGKLVVMSMMKCSVQGGGVPRVKLEVGRGFDGDVLSAGMSGA